MESMEYYRIYMEHVFKKIMSYERSVSLSIEIGSKLDQLAKASVPPNSLVTINKKNL